MKLMPTAVESWGTESFVALEDVMASNIKWNKTSPRTTEFLNRAQGGKLTCSWKATAVFCLLFLWPSKRADITDFSLMEGTLLFQSSLGLTSCEHLQVLTVSQDKGVPWTGQLGLEARSFVTVPQLPRGQFLPLYRDDKWGKEMNYCVLLFVSFLF